MPTHARPRRVASGRAAALTLGLGVALATAPSAAVAAPETTTIPRATPTNLETVLAWFDATNGAVQVPGWPNAGNTQISASRVWAAAWGAADEALTDFGAERGKRAKGDAPARRLIVARAVHDVIVRFVPAYQEKADAQLAETQKGVGDAPGAKLADELATKAAAKWWFARKADGLDPASINTPFTPPPAANGVWQPTLPAFASGVQASQSKGKPFIDPDVATKIAPEPPAIDSDAVIADLNEIDKLGGTSPEQTAARGAARTRVARFWSQASVAGFTSILRQVILGEGQTLAEQTKLLSVFHQVTTDVQIATYASKYKYLRWRPVTALRTDDGNPKTPYDPTFTPLISTPAHPEYPAGHIAYATAAERVFKALIRPIPQGAINATSTALPGQVISYLNWSSITDDNVNARVWEGVHLRSTNNITRNWVTKLAKSELRQLGIDPSVHSHES